MTEQSPRAISHPKLVAFGVPIAICGGVFAARILWEETSLTIQQGPQMIGFSLAHIYPWAFLAPISLALWILVAAITLTISLVRRRRVSWSTWGVLSFAVLVLITISVPPSFWQWSFNGKFASSSQTNAYCGV